MNPTLLKIERAKLPLFALAVTLAAASWLAATRGNASQDLFIFRAAAELPRRGLSPYDTEALRAEVGRQFPESPEFVANCGFFMTPQAVAFFTPLTLLPWPATRVAWTALSFAALVAGLWRLPVPAGRDWWVPVLGLAVLADPLPSMVASVGQTTALMAGLLLLGYAALTRGWAVAGALAWSVLFLKPHVALPLLPLTFALGGPRALAVLVVAVAGGNLLGLALMPDPVGLPLEYLRHLAEGHKVVLYNRVEYNPLITSWNSALVAAGGPVVELGIVGTLAGYAAVAALVAVRRRGGAADPEWLLAVVAASVPVFCQVLGYELLLLVGVLPLVAQRWPGTPWWRLAVLGGFWLLKSVPVEAASALADAVGQGRLGSVVLAYRAFAGLGVLGVVLTLPPSARRGLPPQ